MEKTRDLRLQVTSEPFTVTEPGFQTFRLHNEFSHPSTLAPSLKPWFSTMGGGVGTLLLRGNLAASGDVFGCHR